MKLNRKEILSIPNCLGYFRILLIPVFILVYWSADSIREYYFAAGLVVLSAITDFIDGKIARKFNMITELGKFIDPLADKLTHGAIALCLIMKYRYMKYLVLVMILKEIFMLLMGAVNLRHGRKLDGAKMHGKICTTGLFLILAILICIPGISIQAANSLIFSGIILMLTAWAMYVPVFYKMRQSWDKTGE